MAWIPRTFDERFAETVRAFPANEFIVHEDRRLTYEQAQRQVDKLAKGFISLGVKRGDRVAIWVSNYPEFIIVWLAVAKVGAAPVAMNTRYKSGEVDYLLGKSEASSFVFMDVFANVNYADMVYQLCPELRTCRPGQLESARFPELKNVISIADKPYGGTFSLKDVEALGKGVGDEQLAARANAVQPDDPALIIFTSGTTGVPKGVVHCHSAILKNEERITRWQGVTAQDRRLVFLPPYHIAGSCTGIIGTLMRGGCMVLMPTFDPENALRLIEKEHCTIVDGIPTHFIMMMEHPAFKEYDLSSVRGGWAGGARVTKEVALGMIHKMGMREMMVAYGMTETISGTSFTRVGDPLELITDTDGIPLSVSDPQLFGTPPGFEVGILDAGGKKLPAGSEGEVCVRGDIVMLEYYGMPEETKKAIDPEGWFHTGDLGKMFQNGYLRITGRLKDMFIIGGTNAYPAEIESFYAAHPKIKMVQVTGVPDHRLGEVGIAFIELKHGAAATAEEMVAYARENIANYKVPRYVRFMKEQEWPFTPTGKIQKFRLREMASEELGLALIGEPVDNR